MKFLVVQTTSLGTRYSNVVNYEYDNDKRIPHHRLKSNISKLNKNNYNTM